MKFMNTFFYSPDNGGGSAGAAETETETENTEQADQQPLDFDNWIKAQDTTIQGLVTGHITGLKNALDGERNERKKLAKDLRDATGKLEEGSQARTQLEAVSTKLEALEQQAEFYEAAHLAGVTNLRLAWLAARDLDLVDRKGNIDLEALRVSAPELFRQKTTPAGNAGNGTNQPPPKTQDMNALIRRAAGR